MEIILEKKQHAKRPTKINIKSKSKNKFHFTNRKIERLPYEQEGSREYTDDKTPLKLRVSKNRKSYTCRLFMEGRKVRMTIAEFGEITLEKAREKARKLKWQAKRGTLKLPNEDKSKNITLREFFTERMKVRKTRISAERFHSDERRLELHIYPTLGYNTKIKDLKSKNIAHMCEAIETGKTAERVKMRYEREYRQAKKDAKEQGAEHKVKYRQMPKGGHEAAHSCVSLISALLQDAVMEDIIDRNPAREFTMPKRKKSPGKYLTQTETIEIGRFLRESYKSNTMVCNTILLLMLTGCRRNEIASLKWEYIDFETQCINFPASKTGPKRTFIGKIVVETLQDICKESGYLCEGYVFPSQRTSRYYTGIKSFWRRAKTSMKIPKVRIHDFRHTFASVAAEAGENPQNISALLGHSDGSMTGRYTHLRINELIKTADKVSSIIYKRLGFSDNASETQAKDDETSKQMQLPF